MFSFSAFFGYLLDSTLWAGAWTTIWLTAVTMFIGLVLGLLLAVMRSDGAPAPVRGAANFYVWLFRGTPLLVTLIIIYTGLPQVGLKFSALTAAIIGLSLNEAAYLSEIARSGIMSVPKGQFEAARALGMTPMKVMKVVVMPQALRIMVPPLGNSFNGLLKTTTLVATISVTELLRVTQFAVQLDFRVLEGLLAAACMYLLLTSLWDAIQRVIEKRVNRGYASRTSKKETIKQLSAAEHV